MVEDSHTRRGFVSAVGAAVAVGSAGCLSDIGEGDGASEFTMASSLEQGESVVHAGELFQERIEEESDGELSVEFVPGGAYGSEPESIDLLSEGGLEMYTGGSDPFDMWASEYYFFNTPFVLDDFEHTNRIMETDEFQDEVFDGLEDNNVRVVGERMYRGQRHFTSNEPVETPEDVEGVDLRLPEHESWITAWEELGANPTPVALDELYSGLETGIVGASEGPPAQIAGQSLYEVQDYYSLTNHQPQSGSMYINTTFYETLDEAHQDLIMEVGDEVTAEASQWGMDEEENLLDDIEDEGMEIIEDVDVDAFYAAAEPALEDLFESMYAGTWDEWQNV